MRIEKSCPLPKTIRGYDRRTTSGTEVEIAYADADAFVRELNNFLSAARSVTFVLQAEGRRRDKTLFNAWYEQEQDAMRSDPRLKWLVAARNEVEKEGDLDTHSVAQVSVATTNVDLDFGAIEVPPLASPSEIAAAVEIDDLPDRIRKQAVLVVERRWTVPELPDDELLDVLGHCYGRIADVVREAHALFGVTMQTFGGETHEGRHRREPHPSGRLPCMLPTTEMRTAYWHLEEDTLVEVVRESQPAPSSDEMAEIEEEGRRRYGDLAGHQWMPGTDLVTQARTLHRIAREILVADGYHITIAWLFRDRKRSRRHVLNPLDHQGKILEIRALAQDVEQTGADAVVLTSEMWIAKEVAATDERFLLRATDREDRQEALITVLLQRSGEHHRFMTLVGRDADEVQPRDLPEHLGPEWALSGRIVVGEVAESLLKSPDIYHPITEVWARWNASKPA